ncbi:MAG TPA: VOC family protein [Flavipsychrobacter sp.]|nr:VOC family protein [Flavipsychrobacter sp.]
MAKVPEGYQAVMPYLILDGATEFIKFTQKVFGAEEKMKVMRNENTVMHAEISIGGSVIMFADSTDQYPEQPGVFFIYVDNADDTYKSALSEGATVVSELTNQDYGRSGGVMDTFGNTWYITTMQ